MKPIETNMCLRLSFINCIEVLANEYLSMKISGMFRGYAFLQYNCTYFAI
jgi:hypothetical protein